MTAASATMRDGTVIYAWKDAVTGRYYTMRGLETDPVEHDGDDPVAYRELSRAVASTALASFRTMTVDEIAEAARTSVEYKLLADLMGRCRNGDGNR